MRDSLTQRACYQLHAFKRLAMTGTPFSNRYYALPSLVRVFSIIDGYQGEEKSMVILYFVVSHSEMGTDLGFTTASDRMNLTFTRANNVLPMFGRLDITRVWTNPNSWTYRFATLRSLQ